MDINLASVLLTLRGARIQTLGNTQLPDSQYVFNSLLPDQATPGYKFQGGAIKASGSVASAVPMDTPFPEGGFLGISTLEGNTIKLGLSVTLPEAVQRRVRELLDQLQLGRVTGSAEAILGNAAINFVQDMIVRPHDDMREYLKARAISEGIVNFKSNGVTINIDYSIPTANKFATRSGTAHYGGTASAFNSDMQLARQKLGYNIRGVLMNMQTLDLILLNEANKLVIQSETVSDDGMVRVVQVRRAVKNAEGIAVGFDQNPNFSYTLTGYARELEMRDLANPNNPTIKVPMMNLGRVAVIGRYLRRDILRARTGNSANDSLGYYHVGPTEEGKGVLGRWLQVYSPENQQETVIVKGCENSAPAFDAPERVVLLQTDMA
jgi:hypothetical protein